MVLVFTCVSCPYANEYDERFNSLAKQYGGPNGKVGFVGICVNRIVADRLDKLTEHAAKQKLPFTILYDESQKIAKDYGAIFTTPQYFVLNKDRKITYMGALDDSTDSSKVTQRYLEDAIAATLKGEAAPVKETVPVGCLIRWAREKR